MAFVTTLAFVIFISFVYTGGGGGGAEVPCSIYKYMLIYVHILYCIILYINICSNTR